MFASCLHFNVFAIAPLQEELKCCLVSMKLTGCFDPATFLVQPRGWTRCPQVFSIFSFYDCGINVQIETSLSDVPLPLSLGIQMSMWYQPLPNRKLTDAVIYVYFLAIVQSGTKYTEKTQNPGIMK